MNHTKIAGIVLLVLLFIGGCASYQLDEAQNQIRSSFVNQNFDSGVSLIQQLEKNSVYKEKDRVLKHLEYGTLQHFNGNYKESFYQFEQAENAIDANYTKLISRAIKSFLVNDNVLAYDGEDYENIYINAFKALNFIHLGDLSGAQVEARRMSYKLENLDIRYNGLVNALSKADTTQATDWKLGKAEIQRSSFSHYLSAILYAKMGNFDNSRIEREKLSESLRNQSRIATQPLAQDDELEHISAPKTYNTMIVAFSGRAPSKTQNDTRIFLDGYSTYIKLSLPQLNMFSSSVTQVECVTENGTVITLPLIEQMDVVAKEVYKVKEPIIYGRTIVRSLLKTLSSKALERKAEKEGGELMGSIVGFLGKVGTEATEKADLRGWQTMPGAVYSQVLQLPPGEQTLTMNYKSRYGNILFSKKVTIVVSDDQELHLAETIYPF